MSNFLSVRSALFLALALAPLGVQAKDTVSKALDANGYRPSKIEQAGQRICQNSSNTLLDESLEQGSEISAAAKRQELVEAAVGFAHYFAKHQANQKSSVPLAHPGDAICDWMTSGGDCTGTNLLIRGLASIGPNDDWCAAFVADLAQMVDEQAKGGPANLLHSGGSADASNYASAAKLLAIFDPASSSDISWPGGKAPAKHPEDFIPPGTQPVPGCVAIYTDTKSPNHGHVVLVTSVKGSGNSGSLDTIEGNSAPHPDSTRRGVYAQIGNRPWGQGVGYVADNGDVMEYRGCILPWPGDSMIRNGEVCAEGASDVRNSSGSALVPPIGAIGTPPAGPANGSAAK